MNENDAREAICRFGLSLHERGLTAGSSGNISARLDDGWLLTPTNGSLGRLDPATLSKLDWEGRLEAANYHLKKRFCTARCTKNGLKPTPLYICTLVIRRRYRACVV